MIDSSACIHEARHADADADELVPAYPAPADMIPDPFRQYRGRPGVFGQVQPELVDLRDIVIVEIHRDDACHELIHGNGYDIHHILAKRVYLRASSPGRKG